MRASIRHLCHPLDRLDPPTTSERGVRRLRRHHRPGTRRPRRRAPVPVRRLVLGRGRTREQQARANEMSTCFSVVHEPTGAMVGFARVLTDDVSFGWVADVFVLDDHRGRGVGVVPDAVRRRGVRARVAARARDARRARRVRQGRVRAAHPGRSLDGALEPGRPIPDARAARTVPRVLSHPVGTLRRHAGRTHDSSVSRLRTRGRTRARRRSSGARCSAARRARPRSTPRSRPARPDRSAPERAPATRSPTRTGSASSATSTGSSTRTRGGASRGSARCSSRRRTITCAPGSPTRSRSRRSPPASPASTGLCVPLTEAIALAHDCGHGPAGHASEEAFSPYVPGGYDHAVYGADVTLAPLNLCAETLDGVRNHSWRRPAPSTPEGEVVAWADRIAYVCHDFEDAVRAGILDPGRPARGGRRGRRAQGLAPGRRVRARGARRDRPHRVGSG